MISDANTDLGAGMTGKNSVGYKHHVKLGTSF